LARIVQDLVEARIWEEQHLHPEGEWRMSIYYTPEAGRNVKYGIEKRKEDIISSDKFRRLISRLVYSGKSIPLTISTR